MPKDLSFGTEWLDPFFDIRSVHFSADAKYGWAVGTEGNVLLTVDGGKTWTLSSKGARGTLRSVHFLNDNRNGWAVGSQGIVAGTTDGGMTWKRLATVTGLDLTKVQFVDRSHGWALAQRSRALGPEEMENGYYLISTQDGGNKWLPRAPDPADRMMDIYFTSAANGWGVRGNTIHKTSDGGKSWVPYKVLRGEVIDSGSEIRLQSIKFVSAVDGWAQGYLRRKNGHREGLIFALTTDGGKTWLPQKKTQKDRIALFHYGFMDPQHGWGYDRESFYTTSDGGESWNRQSPLPEEHFRLRFHFINPVVGWRFGDQGALFKTTDGGKSWLPARSTRLFDHTTYPPAAQFVNANLGWLFFPDGRVQVTRDGGYTWSQQWALKSPHVEDDSSIGPAHFLNASHGWIVSGKGEIFGTQDGGRLWKRLSDKLPADLTSIFFINEDVGWVAGKQGVVYATSNGGATWHPQRSGVASDLKSLFFIDQRTGWACGGEGTLLATSNGGAEWVNVSGILPQPREGDSASLKSIQFVSQKTGWITLSKGFLFATTDGGQTWMEQKADYTYLSSVYFANATTGWALGSLSNEGFPEEQFLLGTTDGGRTWSRQLAIPSGRLTSVSGSGKHVWAVGWSDLRIGVPQHEAPFVSHFHVNDGPAETRLRWWVKAKQPGSVKCTAVAFWDGRRNGPTEIDISKIRKLGARDFSLSWSPRSIQYGVEPGSSLLYYVTIQDANGTAYTHQIPEGSEGIIYRPWWQRLPRSLKIAIAVALVLVVYCLLSYLLLWLRPSTFIWLADRGAWASVAQTLPGVQGVALTFLVNATLVPYFAKHPRTREAWLKRYRAGDASLSDLPEPLRQAYLNEVDCLDTWVERRLAKVVEAWENIIYSTGSKVYVPMPVRCSSREESELVAKPEPASFRPYLQTDRIVIAIVGAGGTGKSTLARQMARWALSENGEQRLAIHLMIPVLVDGETQALRDTVKEKLIEMVGAEEVEDDLITGLLRHQRLLVIVDALSEKSTGTQEHIWGIHGRFPVNALIITARREPRFGAVAHTSVQPEQVGTNNLVDFVLEYIRRSYPGEEFPGEEVLDLARRLMQLVRMSSERVVITPLLIALYVENAIRLMRDRQGFDTLPHSVPETMLEYLRRVNPQSSQIQNRLTHENMIRVTRVLGWCSLRDNFVPKAFFRDTAEETLRAEGLWTEGVDAVARLVENGVLEIRDAGGSQLLRFSLDPIAEYLAALYWMDKLRSDKDAWSKWLHELEDEALPLQEIQGFLVALEDCVETYRGKFSLPNTGFRWQSVGA